MIARIWHGATESDESDEYFHYLNETGIPDYRNTTGNLGVIVLRRIENGEAHFLLLTLWDSFESIKKFAGDAFERARYYPEDAKFLLEQEAEVRHYEVLSEFAGGENRINEISEAEQISEIERIIDEMKKAHESDAWFGASLAEALAGINHEQAAARPIENAHSIWEIAAHVRAWEDVFRRRLEGQGTTEPEAGDFPAPFEQSAKAWAELLKELEHTHQQLLSVVEKLPGSILENKIPYKDYSYRFLLREIVKHKVYHAGQIALLKKTFAG